MQAPGVSVGATPSLQPTPSPKLPFHQRRRQQFLLEVYANEQLARREHEIACAVAELGSPVISPKTAWAQCARLAACQYERLSLLYTAGAPIEDLRSDIADVVRAYERARDAKRAVEQRAPVSPFRLELLGDYQRVLQVLALCYLLHRRDLLPRFAELVDVRYQAQDAVYEALMSFNGGLRATLDRGFHARPYAALLLGIRSGSPAEAAAHFKRHVDGWYLHFEREPWHDSHLRMRGTEGDHVGYWAFEAGAAVVLCGSDDTGIDHLTYPRALVAWAQANRALSEGDIDGQARLRCLAGQPCPKDGFWFTPARAGSRQPFTAGTLMPDVGGAYGSTIWQWDGAG